ncbi:MAG TPA: PqqD family protein [Solirubrobacteraceae bacterium]|nr:PqqD family protein [Solirubrobacteraceae bacterium]
MSVDDVRLRPDVVWREIDGEIVLLDLDGSAYFSVSASGAALWPALVAGASTDELASVLSETFALERERAEHDVRAFLQALAGEGLLEGEGRSGGPT